MAQTSVTFRRTLVALAHTVIWTGSLLGAYLLRFDGRIPAVHAMNLVYGLPLLLAARLAVFWQAGLFHGLLRYSGMPEARALLRATTIASVVFAGVGFLAQPLLQPRSVYVGEWLLALLAAGALRMSVRLVNERSSRPRGAGAAEQRVLVLGAGDAAESLLRDVERAHRDGMKVVGLLDDDVARQGTSLRGVPVLGPIDEPTLRRHAGEVSAVVLAIPTASGARNRAIVAMCRGVGLEVKTIPSVQQIVSGEVRVSMLRDVAIEDLLRREPVRLDEASMANLLRGRRVLITGAAGSIGSELARQAARFDPSDVALLDHNENGLFFLDRELRSLFPRLSLRTCIGDIKDARRIRDVIREARPHVILHAAAHKHVPVVEANVGEAVKNNVLGTRVVAELADAFGVETFVMISTDKAVNPTSVMGATKRVAEMLVQSLAERSRTRFIAVRFGNVLGSAGSVVPIFREQIAAGGPVLVTHPEMRRYFMTIPEATQLVLQAAAIAQGGEIFVLDMGEPVKIVDLARDMIRMSGFEPDVEMPIVFTGLRPGEKLFEELFHESEGYEATRHPKILVGRIARVPFETLQAGVDALVVALDEGEGAIRSRLSELVPEGTLGGAQARCAKADEVVAALEPLTGLQNGLT